MAGLVHVLFGSSGFLMDFAITEFIALLSHSEKEGMQMSMKVWNEIRTFAVRIERRLTSFREAHLPSRQSLLMSL